MRDINALELVGALAVSGGFDAQSVAHPRLRALLDRANKQISGRIYEKQWEIWRECGQPHLEVSFKTGPSGDA